MQAINFFRATFCNSSYSAFKIALCDSKKIYVAKRIITAKNENAHDRLSKLNSNCSNYSNVERQVLKYEFFLKKINFINGS